MKKSLKFFIFPNAITPSQNLRNIDFSFLRYISASLLVRKSGSDTISINGTPQITSSNLIGILSAYIPYREALYSRQTERVRMIQEEKLILLPMSDVRGYDTSGMRAGVYISEAQNMSINLMKLALQRIGEDSVCIIDGDFLCYSLF